MTDRYTRTAVTLHWIIALLIFAAFPLDVYMHDLPLSPDKLRLYSWHKWIGITVFLLALARISWRSTHQPPPLPAAMPPLEKFAAHAVHYLLYVLILAIPISGWLMSSVKGVQTVWFGVLPLPDTSSTSVDLRNDYDIRQNLMKSAALSGNFSFARPETGTPVPGAVREEFARLSLSLVQNRTVSARSTSLNLRSYFRFWNSKVRFAFEGTYNPTAPPDSSHLPDQRWRIEYWTQCCGFLFEYLSRDYTQARRQDFRFTVDLRGIGKRIDRNGPRRTPPPRDIEALRAHPRRRRPHRHGAASAVRVARGCGDSRGAPLDRSRAPRRGRESRVGAVAVRRDQRGGVHGRTRGRGPRRA